MENTSEEMLESIGAIEKSIIAFRSKKDRLRNLHILGYLLSERKTFYKDGHEFNDINELILYMNELMEGSLARFEDYCLSLLDENNELDLQLEAFLISIGKTEKINKWKQSLQA